MLPSVRIYPVTTKTKCEGTTLSLTYSSQANTTNQARYIRQKKQKNLKSKYFYNDIYRQLNVIIQGLSLIHRKWHIMAFLWLSAGMLSTPPASVVALQYTTTRTWIWTYPVPWQDATWISLQLQQMMRLSPNSYNSAFEIHQPTAHIDYWCCHPRYHYIPLTWCGSMQILSNPPGWLI